MSANVIAWYLDVIGCFLVLIISVMLICIFIRKLYLNPSDAAKKQKLSIKLSIYFLYFASILLFLLAVATLIILPIFKKAKITINQFIVCDTLYSLTTVTFAMYEIAIINLFIERLRISFKNTAYQLTKCTNYVFRIFYFIIWIVLCVYIIITNRGVIVPYNIYILRKSIIMEMVFHAE